MLAMDIGFSWFLRGEEALGSGWLSRAQLLEGEPDCAEHGYLQAVQIDAALAQGDFDTAIDVARQVAAIAARHADETLMAYALVGEGIATIKQGRVAAGLAGLDEAMLPRPPCCSAHRRPRRLPGHGGISTSRSVPGPSPSAPCPREGECQTVLGRKRTSPALLDRKV